MDLVEMSSLEGTADGSSVSGSESEETASEASLFWSASGPSAGVSFAVCLRRGSWTSCRRLLLPLEPRLPVPFCIPASCHFRF